MTDSYIMRHMLAEDIAQVIEIDRASFPNPWPKRTYEHEIENSSTAQMIVVEAAHSLVALPPLATFLRRWWMPRPSGQVVGYGGCWLIAGEAHISTIAVHPNFRGRGLGELLLMGMLQRALNLEAEYSVLEVRVSNDSALALYFKYEYEIVGRRRRYYRDNGEDAHLMEARPLDAAYQARLFERVKTLQKRLHFVDHFTSEDR